MPETIKDKFYKQNNENNRKTKDLITFLNANKHRMFYIKNCFYFLLEINPILSPSEQFFEIKVLTKNNIFVQICQYSEQHTTFSLMNSVFAEEL